MLSTLPKKLLYLLGAIFVINMVQAYFTELIFDEAYYTHYARNFSFGYFDHPPMVAWFISLGNILFQGNLGVRFVSCLLSVGTLLVLWKTIDHPKKNEYVSHFVVLAFSMTLLNAYGFLTLPDTPLLFFCALFLFVYKHFVEKPSALLALALGLVMSALMYSKYNAVLIIVFVLLSNLKLLSNKFAWLAVITALAAYIPHFMWLYEQDFISVQYHLFERRNDAYNFNKYTIGFLVNLVALFGLTFPWIYRSLFRSKAKDAFTKALIYLTYGVLIFFFISSFNRRVQTQWLIVICIPLVILVFNDMIANDTSRKWIYRLGLVNIAILLFLRVGLVFDPLFPIYYETHGNKHWVHELRDKIGDTPVVFENSYRLAPMYAYYSGSKTFSLNNINYRQNQYSLDESENEMQGKKVYYVSRFLNNAEVAFTNIKGDAYYGKYVDNFESFRKLRCDVVGDGFVMDTEKVQQLKVYNPYATDIDLNKLKFAVGYLNDYKRLQDIIPITVTAVPQSNMVLKANDTTHFTFILPPPKMKDPAYFRVSISENDLHFGLNGKTIKFD
ncbi:glycosyltransferase family 39 protein [Maribacter sp.]|nr:glycosyltransferase family 39 protein [Maribacter sp.]